MKNVLLPTDFSENSWNAIKYALDFHEKIECNFFLLHVNRLSHAAISHAPYLPTQEVIEDVYTKPAKMQLDNMLKRIIGYKPQSKKHKFYTISDYNFFVESIREHVEEKNIDLIVMGTKGASGLRKVIVGSNAGDVITKVACSTLVVPENASFKKIEEIAFPTDFSLQYNINTLEPILKIVQDNQAALRVVHISKRQTDLNRDQMQNKELLEDYFHANPHSFHFLTNKKVEKAVQCFVESRDVDMITMIGKNLNYFQQILFHSKVEEISYHINIPFLVLHN
ncbi:universal stress protein [Xanthomarina sp. F2636L]|uniref:universal stress protein n=1 Tax=Xanthomarina sp. F2636L TaxID=2996018 RepID=UPI00225E3EFC|nr:universal stress protein [Xanthomarina sp. F2636L]MCX7551735.1 universal stress protein [Xanthomarina sp. F2636L]